MTPSQQAGIIKQRIQSAITIAELDTIRDDIDQYETSHSGAHVLHLAELRREIGAKRYQVRKAMQHERIRFIAKVMTERLPVDDTQWGDID